MRRVGRVCTECVTESWAFFFFFAELSGSCFGCPFDSADMTQWAANQLANWLVSIQLAIIWIFQFNRHLCITSPTSDCQHGTLRDLTLQTQDGTTRYMITMSVFLKSQLHFLIWWHSLLTLNKLSPRESTETDNGKFKLTVYLSIPQ